MPNSRLDNLLSVRNQERTRRSKEKKFHVFSPEAYTWPV